MMSDLLHEGLRLRQLKLKLKLKLESQDICRQPSKCTMKMRLLRKRSSGY